MVKKKYSIENQMEFLSIQSEIIAIFKMMNYLAAEKAKLELKLKKLI